MRFFMDTTGTIADGNGFTHFGQLHLIWIAAFLSITLLSCLWFRKAGETGRRCWKRTVAVLLVLDEIFKQTMLLAGGRFNLSYLPIHLCSINIFIIAVHAFKASTLWDSFLYTVCIPGAIAALLFPTWTKLPFMNFMHLHSFTVHILLALYPIVLAVGGEINPRARDIPKCLLLLVAMAVPIYIINILIDQNFMFLMYAEEGNPLYWFQQNWGNHLLGFPVIIAGVLIIMYLPIEIYHKFKKLKA